MRRVLLGEMMSATRVMIVEDDPKHRQLFAAWLELAGFQIIMVSDEHTAQATAAAQRPDIVLVDIRMPHISGLDVIGSIRSTTAGRLLPIVAILVLSSRKDEEACLAAGADRFLKKPARMHELVSAIRDAASRPAPP